MSNNQGEKLKALIKQSGLNVSEVAKMLDVSREHMYKYFKNKELPSWLLEVLQNRGFDIEAGSYKPTQIANNNIKSELLGVPIYDIEVTAGSIGLCELSNGNIIGHISYPAYKSFQGFVKVTGDSMEPKFSSGDYVGFKKIEDKSIIQYGQNYIIETSDNQRMLKVIRKGSKEGYVTIHSLNQKYEDFEVPLKKIKNIYIVLAKIGGF